MSLPIAGGGLETYDRIPQEILSWLIPDLVPRDELVLVAGASGVGKSTLFSSLISHVTGGRAFGSHALGPPGRALLYALEESAGGAPLERLACVGADLSRVVCGERIPGGRAAALPYLPDGLAALRDRIVQCRASLCVIDPLSSLLCGGVRFSESADVRSVLTPLQQLARDLGCTIMYTLNYRKSTTGDASNWVSGHKDLWNVPRHILALGRDPRQDGRYVLAVGKQTRGAPLPSLSYRICYEGTVAYMDVLGASSSTAHDLGCNIEDDLTRSARELARAYLRTVLTEGDERAARLLTECETAGFSRHTLDRAATDLGVRREFRAVQGERAWWWRAPEKWPE